ncbi:MAG: radical SAM protein [bacterium]|nr:radical SAM protein [bacterium]
MSNIILNSNCNRRCAYCFSNADAKETKQMSLDTLTTICDFLERSRKRKINVLGGEPTLHPQFGLFLEYLLSRGFTVHIFTNGMMPDAALKEINRLVDRHRLNHRKLKFIINVNEEKYRSSKEKKLQERTMDSLHKFSTLSFNIFEEDCSLDFLTDLIVNNQLIGEIRLGLASPISGKENQFLPTGAFDGIARKISTFSALCQENNIDLVFDCGFPLCIFTDDELGKLYKNKTQLKFVCHPIPDIDPDLNITHCYPLAKYFPQKLDRFRDLEDIRSYFRSHLSKDAGNNGRIGIFETCRECRYRERGMCSAGCKGHYS